MAESGLSCQLSDLAAAVGRYLGFGATATGWTGWNAATPYVPIAVGAVGALDTQLGQIMECIVDGYHEFLYPKLVDEDPYAYEWTFLTPRRTMAIVTGSGVYDLPDDFRDLMGELTYQPSDSTLTTVEQVGIGQVDRFLQQTFGLTGKPQWCAVYPKETDGVSGQRWSISFAPLPDANYTLTYRSSVLPRPLSANNPFPYGGMAHRSTLIESCLAIAESRFQDEPQGNHQQLFAERLKASIAVDRESKPQSLGYCGDRSDTREQGWSAWDTGSPWSTQITGVTYNGAPLT